MSRRLTSFPRCVLSCPPFFHLAYPPDLHLHQTSDRTARMCEAITRYDRCEVIPVRMQDAFDRNWWERVSGGAASSPSPTELPVDLHGEGSCDRPSVELSQIIDIFVRFPHCFKGSSPQLAYPYHHPVYPIYPNEVDIPYTAYSIGASHLVLGTTLTSLSISLISSISQGGGFVVPQAIQEEWIPPFVEHAPGAATSWRGEVRLSRPLRDVGLKECTAWVWWHQLSVVGKQRVVLLSSTELFYVYGQTLEGCATLSTGRLLFDLLGVFEKWLRVYAGKHAPRIGSAVVNPSLSFAASTQNCASSMLVSPPSMLTPPLLPTSSQPPLIAAVASANTAAHASTL